MTPTMKVKRDVVMKKYNREIDSLYAADGSANGDSIL
jgi:long-subunit acyl-CoA synthetase (AMP-forming)